MKAIFCVFELSDQDIPSVEYVSQLTGMPAAKIKVKDLLLCSAGYERNFLKIADLYLWTFKYRNGFPNDRPIFIELRGISEIPLLLRTTYSDQLRFSISAETLKIFDKDGKLALDRASRSASRFIFEERIDSIKPYISELEQYYRLLYVHKNPFILIKY